MIGGCGNGSGVRVRELNRCYYHRLVVIGGIQAGPLLLHWSEWTDGRTWTPWTWNDPRDGVFVNKHVELTHLTDDDAAAAADVADSRSSVTCDSLHPSINQSHFHPSPPLLASTRYSRNKRIERDHFVDATAATHRSALFIHPEILYRRRTIAQYDIQICSPTCWYFVFDTSDLKVAVAIARSLYCWDSLARVKHEAKISLNEKL